MDKKDKIKKIIMENILVIGIMTLYLIFGMPMFPLGIFLIPVPFIVLGVKNGLSNNIISMTITFLIIGLIDGITGGLTSLIMFLPVSILINYCLIKRKSASKTILYASLIFMLCFSLTIFIENGFSTEKIATRFETNISSMINGQMDLLKDSKLSETDLMIAEETLETILRGAIMIMPSSIILVSVLSSYLCYIIASMVLMKIGIGVVDIPTLSKIKLPNDFILGSGIMFLMVYLMDKMKLEYSTVVLLNITFLVVTAFMVQGFAVFDYFLKKLKIGVVFRVIIIALNIVVLPISTIILLLGFLDSVIDFRKLRKKES